MSDPVAEKSTFLKMYMSNHPDTLVAYAKFYGKIEENIASAEMTAIDSKNMTLSYKTTGGKMAGVAAKEVIIQFQPPLSGYHDVKPRLLEMKALAQEGLGMISVPKISSFKLPTGAFASIFIMAFASYLTFSPKDSSAPYFAPAQRINFAIGGSSALNIFWSVTFGLHFLESLYTYTLCKKHRTGFAIGLLYVISTVIIGFPIWVSLRKRIQAARIESVMKVE